MSNLHGASPIHAVNLLVQAETLYHLSSRHKNAQGFIPANLSSRWFHTHTHTPLLWLRPCKVVGISWKLLDHDDTVTFHLYVIRQAGSSIIIGINLLLDFGTWLQISAPVQTLIQFSQTWWMGWDKVHTEHRVWDTAVFQHFQGVYW